MMQQSIYKQFCDIAYDAAGIRLGASKQALVDARVSRRLRHLGIETHKEYLSFLQSDDSGKELASFLNAITTNFTSFFREPSHFDFLRRYIREEMHPEQRTLRIWCAASATGEEPYTLAISVLEALEGRSIDAKILATDISTDALTKAKEGVYPKATIEPLTVAQRARFLEMLPGKEKMYRVGEEARKLLAFRRLNLAKPPFPMKGPFDLIFCRNVMIYFDAPIKQGLVTQMERLLRPGGYVLTGHSETLGGLNTNLKLVRPSIYHKLPMENP